MAAGGICAARPLAARRKPILLYRTFGSALARSPYERAEMRDQPERPPPEVAALIRATCSLHACSVDLHPECLDDRHPVSNVVFEGTPEFLRVRIEIGLESQFHQLSLERRVRQGGVRGPSDLLDDLI